MTTTIGNTGFSIGTGSLFDAPGIAILFIKIKSFIRRCLFTIDVFGGPGLSTTSPFDAFPH